MGKRKKEALRSAVIKGGGGGGLINKKMVRWTLPFMTCGGS